MPTPILRNNVGAVVSVTTANAVANNAYAAAADKLTIDNSTNKALLADFELTPTFAAAPVAGVVQLFAVDYSLDGTTAGPTPAATMQPRLVGTFSPQPLAANAAPSWKMALNAVALPNKADYFIYNNGTAQSINTGWVLKAQSWSPGA